MTSLNQDTFLKLGSVFGTRMRLTSGDVPTIAIRVKKGQNLSGAVNEIVNAL
jgi:hypothetical protein